MFSKTRFQSKIEPPYWYSRWKTYCNQNTLYPQASQARTPRHHRPVPLGTTGPYPQSLDRISNGNGHNSDEIGLYRGENISIYVVFRVEIEFDIRFCVIPQKAINNCEKQYFRSDLFFRRSAHRFLFAGKRCADFFGRGWMGGGEFYGLY